MTTLACQQMIYGLVSGRGSGAERASDMQGALASALTLEEKQALQALQNLLRLTGQELMHRFTDPPQGVWEY